MQKLGLARPVRRFCWVLVVFPLATAVTNLGVTWAGAMVASAARAGTLQALGAPSESMTCNGFRTPATGAHLVVSGGAKGGISYTSGFQLTASATCSERSADWTWHLGADYTSLKADIGLDLSNAPTCSTQIMRFIGSAGAVLPFVAGGKTVEGTYIPKTGVKAVAVGLAQQKTLDIRVTFVPGTCPTGAAAVDVVNDHLS
jgi:hypothetical protein